jgi:cobalt-zinc-cadmium efflux system membrane fusion protein
MMAAIMLGMMLSACSGDDPTKASEKGAQGSNKTQLFTVPKEQASHIQIVTIQPTSWPRVLRLNGTVAYNGFLTTPVISQVSGPVSRILVSPGQQPGLLPASSELPEGARRSFAGSQELSAIKRPFCPPCDR